MIHNKLTNESATSIVYRLIVQCFQVGPTGFNKTFKKWLDSKTYREAIAAGKGKLEWDRKVAEDKIVNLKELLNCDAFNENLPNVSRNRLMQYENKILNHLFPPI